MGFFYIINTFIFVKKTLKMDEEFEKLIQNKCDNTEIRSRITIVILSIITIFIFYYSIKIKILYVLVLFLLYAIYFLIKKSKGNFKGGKYWLQLIQTNPQNIVWILPIVVNHNIAIVLTLYKTREFQILTKDKINVTIKCDSEKDQKIFLEGMKNNCPDAHVGYKQEAIYLYNSNPSEFINLLKDADLYTSVSSF